MSVFTNPASSTPQQTAQYVGALLELLGDRDPVAVMRETAETLPRLVAATPPGALTTRP